MKPSILIHSIAALLVALPLSRAEEKKAEEKNEAQKAEKSEKKSSSSSIVTTDGTATITIDINGKKETRTFKLGEGKVFIPGKDGDGAKAGGEVGFGGKGFVKPEHGKREKGPWLGIAMEPVQDVVRAQLPLAPGEGVVIGHVAPESPAAKAGLQPNDILLRFEDQIIVEPGQLKKLIAMKKAGDSVKLTYLRKGERKDATVSLVEHEIDPGEGNPIRLFQNGPGAYNVPIPGMNLRLEQLQDQLRQMKEKHQGVIVDKQAWITGASRDALKERLEKLQRTLKDSELPKEVIEDMRKELELLKLVTDEAEQHVKRSPGSPEEMLKQQIEKLQHGLDESKLPKEEIERLRKELEHAQREAMEAMERARHGTEEAVKNAQRAVEDAARTLNESRKPHEKEKGEQPKRLGEPR